MDARLLTRVMEEAASSRENAVTEVLATLLEHPPLGDAFLQKALQLDTRATRLSVERQYENQAARGYPDLALLDVGLFALVECKLNAGLTDLQPQEYAKELVAFRLRNPTSLVCLALVAPEARVAPLSAECCSRLGRERGSSFAGEGVHLRTLSWRAVAAVFEKVPLEGAAAFVRDSFCQLCAYVEAQASRCLTEEDVVLLTDPKVLRAVAALEDCLHELIVLGKRTGYDVKPRYEYDCQGFYASPRSHPEREVWVGVSHRTGSALGVAPLFVQLMGKGFATVELQRVRDAGWEPVAPTEPDWVAGHIIPLRINADLDPPSHATTLWSQVEAIIAAAFDEGRSAQPDPLVR